MRRAGLAVPVLLALNWAVPAFAEAASKVPEPNDLLLLGIGVVGLIVGRQAARKKKPRD